jgi:hypothetical protein
MSIKSERSIQARTEWHISDNTAPLDALSKRNLHLSEVSTQYVYITGRLQDKRLTADDAERTKFLQNMILTPGAECKNSLSVSVVFLSWKYSQPTAR